MCDDLVKRLRELHQEEFGDAWDFAFACQQAMNEAADAIEELKQNIEQYKLYLQDAINDLRSAHEKEPKWIPVTEKLPEEEESVFVVRKFLGVKGQVPPSTYTEIAYRCGDRWIADSDEYKIARHRHTDPLYWMPLPQPPKEV